MYMREDGWYSCKDNRSASEWQAQGTGEETKQLKDCTRVGRGVAIEQTRGREERGGLQGSRSPGKTGQTGVGPSAGRPRA